MSTHLGFAEGRELGASHHFAPCRKEEMLARLCRSSALRASPTRLTGLVPAASCHLQLRRSDPCGRATSRGVATSALLDPLIMLAQEPQTIAGYTPSEDVVKFLSVAPPILLQFVFFSPLSAVKAFRDSGTTGDVSIMPYTMMVANGTLWFTYGALLSNPTIMLPNITAIVMGAGYCATFLKYKSPQAVVTPYVASSAGLVAATIGSAALLPLATSQQFIGYLGCGVCVAMFGGPLASISAVLRDQSAAAIPLGFTVFSIANTSVWLSYGALVLGDPFIWAPNVLGLGSSLTQLALIARYGTAPRAAVEEAAPEEGAKPKQEP